MKMTKTTATHRICVVLVSEPGEEEVYCLTWTLNMALRPAEAVEIKVLQGAGGPMLPVQAFVPGVPIEVMAAFGEMLSEHRRGRHG